MLSQRGSTKVNTGRRVLLVVEPLQRGARYVLGCKGAYVSSCGLGCGRARWEIDRHIATVYTATLSSY